jgi:hypothetical protein
MSDDPDSDRPDLPADSESNDGLPQEGDLEETLDALLQEAGDLAGKVSKDLGVPPGDPDLPAGMQVDPSPEGMVCTPGADDQLSVIEHVVAASAEELGPAVPVDSEAPTGEVPDGDAGTDPSELEASGAGVVEQQSDAPLIVEDAEAAAALKAAEAAMAAAPSEALLETAAEDSVTGISSAGSAEASARAGTRPGSVSDANSARRTGSLAAATGPRGASVKAEAPDGGEHTSGEGSEDAQRARGVRPFEAGDSSAFASSMLTAGRDGARSAVVIVLNAVNRPFRGISVTARRIIGYVALITLAFAAVAWGICLFR